jgi:hypothetical protein
LEEKDEGGTPARRDEDGMKDEKEKDEPQMTQMGADERLLSGQVTRNSQSSNSKSCRMMF